MSACRAKQAEQVGEGANAALGVHGRRRDRRNGGTQARQPCPSRRRKAAAFAYAAVANIKYNILFLCYYVQDYYCS